VIEVTTSKQWAWCKTCDGLIVRESADRIWSHARSNNHCHNLVVEPFISATEIEMASLLRNSR